jgi:hypothetical protein
MNFKNAEKLITHHQLWRRGEADDMVNPTELGKSIDVLLAAPKKHYGDIATELRDAAIGWRAYISDESSFIVYAFCSFKEPIHSAKLAKTDTKKSDQWRMFLLFVAEAITW